MAFSQGEALPNITQTTTTTDTAPDYYKNYLTGLGQAGKKAMDAPASTMISPLDAYQTTAYNAIPKAADAYITGIDNAQLTADAAAKGIDPARINALMNPYTQNVTDEMARLSQQNMQRNIMPSMKAGFVGTGGLGGQRYANALGQSMSDVQSNLTGQQYGALSSGYTQALKAAQDESTLKNQAAQTQAKIAEQEQTLGLTSAGALSKAGAEKQKYNQSILDYPMSAATNASGLMRGFTVPNTQTNTFVGPKAGSYKTSDLANISSILALLGSGTGTNGTGTPLGTNLGAMGSGLLRYLTGGAGVTNATGNIYAGTNAEGVTVYYRPDGSYEDSSGNIVPITGSEGE